MANNWTKLKNGKYDWLTKHNFMDLDLLQRFIDDNGFVSVSTCRDLTTMKWFLQNGKDVGKYSLNDMPPQDDHGYYFKYKSGECVYVYQPYADKPELELKVKQYAERLDLCGTVYDSTHSWYYPHNSLLVVISLPHKKIIVPDVAVLDLK